MVKRIRFTADAFEKYLDGLNEKFNTSILWNTLSRKSEYGMTKSEKAYQTRAAFKAALMAQKLGLNEERTSFYSKCLGAAFPLFGKEGKKCIEEYAIIHDLPYEQKETMASVIEECFAQSGKFVVEGLREILLELFDESSDSDVPEIELAKLYHEQMEILKIFDRISSEEYAESEKRLDEQIDQQISEIGIAGCKKQLIAYKENLHAVPASMTEEEKEDYFKCIDQFKDYSGDECLINFTLHATKLK